MSPSFFHAVVENGVWTLPYLILLGVGFAIVLQLRDRNPPAAAFALVAFALLGLTALAGTLLSAWFFQAVIGSAPDTRTRLATIYGVLNGMKAVITLAAWILLIAGLRKALLGPEPRP